MPRQWPIHPWSIRLCFLPFTMLMGHLNFRARAALTIFPATPLFNYVQH